MRLRMIYIIVLLSLPLVTWARQDSIKQEQKNRHVLSDGSVYIGQMKLRKPSGTGRMEYVNGDVYEGAFEKGLRKGVGICRYSNGEIYTGYWEDDVRSGEGELQYTTGDVYK